MSTETPIFDETKAAPIMSDTPREIPENHTGSIVSHLTEMAGDRRISEIKPGEFYEFAAQNGTTLLVFCDMNNKFHIWHTVTKLV